MQTSRFGADDSPRRTVAAGEKYGDAEGAVDWLSDHGFPVERVSIGGDAPDLNDGRFGPP